MKPTLTLLLAIASAAVLLHAPALAQPIRIANIVELSGAGTTSGTNFKDGVQLAVLLRARGMNFFESQKVHSESRGALMEPALFGVTFELVHSQG